ncbi:DUF3054 domain-containing protein [Arthrobacter sulfonylureivorans]|uniref:DUF3054 domain-containing protein n=1 Tax=Arthrobacter sulfonylureivorans TaxID=2486855 RepID=UPI0039E39563
MTETSPRLHAGLPLAAGSLALDLAAIVLFAAAGRNTHEHGLAVVGILLTAAPFLIGALIGWAVVRGWRRPIALWPTGVAVWLAAVVLGLALRGLAGGGLAVSFQIVTFLVLGALLLGWRALATLFIKLRFRRRVE